MLYRSTNISVSALRSSLPIGATTLTLLPGTGDKFWEPTLDELTPITLSNGPLNEIVYVTARDGDVCTVIRAREGTLEQAWPANTTAQNLITAGQLNAMLQALDKGVRSNEWACRVTGDAVRDSDGGWTGPDVSVPLRNEWLQAKALGLVLYIFPGNYRITDSIVRAGDLFDALGNVIDNVGIRGEPKRSRIICMTEDRPPSFQVLNFNGTLEIDGVTGDQTLRNPVYFLTEDARQGDTVVTLSTTTAIEQDKWLMLINYGNPVKQYLHTPLGESVLPTGLVGSGQLVRCVSTDLANETPHQIITGGYDPITGFVSLVVDPPTTYGQRQQIEVTGITGTGADLDQLEGVFWLSRSSGANVVYRAELNLDVSTITGGQIQQPILLPNQMRFLPALEADYTASTVNPGTTGTCARRISKSPRNIIVDGLIFDWSWDAPSIGTHVRISMSSLTRCAVRNCEFYGPGTGVVFSQGCRDFEVNGCYFADGGTSTYCISTTTGSSFGRILDCVGINCRHMTNSTCSVSTSPASHILVDHCQAYGMAWSSFADHPGVFDITYNHCMSVGGTTIVSAGFQLRGYNETVVDCKVYGHEIGILVAFANNAMIDGGIIQGCRFGIRTQGALNTRIKNFPRIINSTQFHVLLASTGRDLPNEAMPGLRVEAEFLGTPEIADVGYQLWPGQTGPHYDKSWSFDFRAQGRIVTYAVVFNDTVTISPTYHWDYEWVQGVATKFASWTVVPGLEATFFIDSSAGTAIDVTIPDALLWCATKYKFKKVNTGGGVVTLRGRINGANDLVIPDGVIVGLTSNAKSYNIDVAGNAYTSASGAVLLHLLRSPMDFGQGAKIALSNMVGTASAGDFNTLNGNWTTNPGTFPPDQIRLTGPIGLGTVTIVGGKVVYGGWQTI